MRGSARQTKSSGDQMEAFLPAEMAASETEEYLTAERLAAERMLLSLASKTSPLQIYGKRMA